MADLWMRLPCVAAFLLLTAAAPAQPAPLPLENASFEESHAAGDPRPAGWWPVNPSTVLQSDAATAFEGARSMRLEHAPPFAGAMQRIDAAPLRGHLVVLRARLKGAGIGRGAVGLWLRGSEPDGAITGFATTYARPLEGDTDWSLREARLLVTDRTMDLSLGVTLAAPGRLWVDSVELEAHPLDSLPPLGAAAHDYLGAALDLLQQNAYFSDRVDWPGLRRQAHAIAAGAETPEETYPGIDHAIAALGDGHSHLARPNQVGRMASPKVDPSEPGVTATQLGRIGIIRVPGFRSTHPQRAEAFASALRDHLASQAKSGACGWIIDLRDNTGGNMYPMIRGLSGLLGGETLGWFVHRHEREAWNARQAGVGDRGLQALPGGTTAPVAVLQGPRTASAGEATLLSFMGRPKTRRFGQPSQGLSTGNQPFPLVDGAALAITTSVMADRSGRAYGGKIPPDETVEIDEATETTALRWLRQQPGCAG
mgnify:CR=1 FL=1